MNSGGGGDGDGGGRVLGVGTALRPSSPFTVSQWQELEHQALIFKYMKAGLPVPPDLVLPIQKSFESLSHRFFHHPTMAYCSLYGKKVDPEPGRCRRTDGKKWRCSKDAYPDSKYCERHMHRGRNRSRKPVESQTMTQSSSSVTSMTVSGSTGGTGSFQNLPFSAFGVTQVTGSGPNQSPYLVDNIPYGIPSKDFRYLQGIKAESGEYSFLTEASASNRAIPAEPALENAWPVLQSNKVSLYHQKSGDNSILQTEYPQHSFFNGEFNLGETANKPEGQPLRPFFDEWPKSRDSWPSLAEDRSNPSSFSTTQLSISIPMASSEFSGSSSHPSHGEYESPSQLMSGSIIG